ncbi:hypothetical protein AURDEDRAFT_172406 [Auricularia subglabra TFB-10046 SS5]|nr:hypothetical protein AURDEDRAFT_172406 [Auricularia subglabra TFB-10046 SS5]
MLAPSASSTVSNTHSGTEDRLHGRDKVVPQDDIQQEGPVPNPTDILPNELLVEIFTYLPDWGRMLAATVCSRWRSVSLGAAVQLWSTIVAWMDDAACSALLDRTRDVPITFRLPYLDQGNFSGFCRLIIQHAPHIKALDMTLTAWHQRREIHQMSSEVSYALESNAPILESLRIDNRMGPEIEGFAMIESPKLRNIELLGVDLACLTRCAGSAALRSLVLVTAAKSWGFSPEHWSQFCSFPSLETLAVKITECKPPTLPGGYTPLPRTLKRLCLSLLPDVFRQLTDPRDFSRLDRWSVSFVHYDYQFADFEDIAPYLQSIASASAAIQFDGRLIHLTLTDAAGRQATVQFVRFHPAWSYPLLGAEKLAVGGLGDLPSAVTDVVSAFHSLQELTLDVTPESTAFTSTRYRWPRLSCPSLHFFCKTRSIMPVPASLQSLFYTAFTSHPSLEWTFWPP